MCTKVYLLVIGLLLSASAFAIPLPAPEIDGAGIGIGIALLGASIALIRDRMRHKGK